MFASWKELGNIQNIFEKYFEYKNCIVWDKMWFGMGGNWRPNHEFIMYGISKSKKDNGVIPSNSKENILRHRRVSPQKLSHSCQKPTSLMEEIIEQCGDLILDPFMGSGTTGVACMKTNRKFIGIELDEKYFKISEARINDNTED
jgi:DNA modification methylase